jgi:FtsP/CotA-like multicopper oxidase with cupredoxin domain
MARCSRCGAETELFNSGVPICLSCDVERSNVGGKPTAATTKDTLKVARNSTVEVDLVASKPSPSLLHRHMQQRMDYGFVLLMKYT